MGGEGGDICKIFNVAGVQNVAKGEESDEDPVETPDVAVTDSGEPLLGRCHQADLPLQGFLPQRSLTLTIP